MNRAIQSGNDGSGYITLPEDMANLMLEKGLGYVYPIRSNTIFYPGDIVSTKDHCYIVLGSCSDGSVLLVHTTMDGGVHLSGTVKKNDKYSVASNLAKGYMGRHHAEWFDAHKVPADEYLNGVVMDWNHLFLDDEREVSTLSAAEVLRFFETNRVPRYPQEAPMPVNSAKTPADTFSGSENL